MSHKGAKPEGTRKFCETFQFGEVLKGLSLSTIIFLVATLLEYAVDTASFE